MSKYLLVFEKGESVRWLGHLDILRTFERAIRRAGLPIAFSNGFNPRERLGFASALSTGITGEAERASLELTDAQPADSVAARLNETLPPGLRIGECREITDSEAKALLNAYTVADYAVICRSTADATEAEAQAAIEQLLAQPRISIVREREGRTKVVDIRPNLHSLSLRPRSLANERLTLDMRVSQGSDGTARPQEVAGTLSGFLPGLAVRRMHRVRLLTAAELQGSTDRI